MTPPTFAEWGPSLVLDVGTSAVKAAVVDPSGAPLARAEEDLAPPVGIDGAMEQDSRDWERAARATTTELESRGALDAIRRIVITGQMQDLTLLDERDVAIRPTLLYGDVRAGPEAEEVRARLGVERLRAETGNETDAGGLLAKALWLRRHQPEALARARRSFLGAADLLAYRLSGAHACDTTTASTTGLMRFARREPLLASDFEALGLASFRATLPGLVAGGAPVGRVLSEAARSWGLPEHIPVHVGPGDAGATTIGAGAGVPGRASAYLGTSGWVAVSDARLGDPEAGVFTLAHPDASRAIRIAPLLTAAGNLRWVRDAMFPERDVGELAEAAASRPGGRLVYLPYLAGERAPFRDPAARGAFIGLDASTRGEDMVRAVLEGVALAFRHALEALAPDAGTGVGAPGRTSRPLVLSGGGTRSTGWCRIFADALGMPVQVLGDAELVALRGALRSAQVAAGVADAFDVGVVGPVLRPDPEQRRRLDRLYQAFRSSYPSLRATFASLARPMES